MPIRYDITHTTVYRYAKPVTFGEHRVMFRPRDSHDLRVLATDLHVSPAAMVRMIQDPHSNSVAMVQPLSAATELKIVCSFSIEHAHTNNLELPMSAAAVFYPFSYSVDERHDLEQYLRPHHDDPDGVLIAWARQFIRSDGPTGTRELLVSMNQYIRKNFTYLVRDEEGTQPPLQTLTERGGSCRDFALLMIEAARPARFRGPLRQRIPLRPGARQRRGRPTAPPPSAPAARTPGCRSICPARAGCLSIPPTTCWVAASSSGSAWRATRAQAAPVSGSWYGEADAFLGLEASVVVHRVPSR